MRLTGQGLLQAIRDAEKLINFDELTSFTAGFSEW